MTEDPHSHGSSAPAAQTFLRLLELTKLIPTSEPLPLLFLLAHSQITGPFPGANPSKNVTAFNRLFLAFQLKQQCLQCPGEATLYAAMLYCFHSTYSYPKYLPHLLVYFSACCHLNVSCTSARTSSISVPSHAQAARGDKHQEPAEDSTKLEYTDLDSTVR